MENNSVINAKNEKSVSGGVIKTNSGQNGKINISNSTLNFQNVGRGFVDGTINVKDSTINMKGLTNGINSSPKGLELTLDHSHLTISGAIGRAITLDETNIEIKNHSNLYLSHSGEADIRFKNEGSVSIDASSELKMTTVKLDQTVQQVLENLIVSPKYDYQLDDQGHLVIVEKPGDTEQPGDTQSNDVNTSKPVIGFATSAYSFIYWGSNRNYWWNRMVCVSAEKIKTKIIY